MVRAAIARRKVMIISTLFMFDGPGRVDTLLGMFNPRVGGKVRVCNVRVCNRRPERGGPKGEDLEFTIIGIHMTAARDPSVLNLWLASRELSSRVALVQNYDVIRRNGELTFVDQHTWGPNPTPPEMIVKNRFDALDLTNQFIWRPGQRMPLWFHSHRKTDRFQTYPDCSITEQGGTERFALYLTAAKVVETFKLGTMYKVQAEDLKGNLWHGRIDLISGSTMLWSGPWPLRSHQLDEDLYQDDQPISGADMQQERE